MFRGCVGFGVLASLQEQLRLYIRQGAYSPGLPQGAVYLAKQIVHKRRVRVVHAVREAIRHHIQAVVRVKIRACERKVRCHQQ